MPRAAESTNFPKRFYGPRCIGLGLGFVAVVANLPAQPCHTLVLALLGAYCFGWPHLAYWTARTNARPASAERRSMIADAFFAAFFAATTGFNPIPSAAIVTMVTMNNMAMGGPRFMGLGLGASALGAALAYAAFGTPFTSELGRSRMLACMPLLVLYPMSLGHACYVTALKLRQQKKQLARMSSTDPLTGLTNRAALNDILDQSLRLPGLGLDNSVIALIDADGFKQINDRYGHIAGDQALQRISQIMRACVREQDTVGRYGGDEFCVILRNVTRTQAAQILERMRALAQQNIAAEGNERHATLSIGAAAYSADAGTSAMWIHRADEAMYEAKKGGRNQVVFAA